MEGPARRRNGKGLPRDVRCDGSKDDLAQWQRDQRYALQLDLWCQEEAQLEMESRRWLLQTMGGWDAFPWLHLAFVPGGLDDAIADAIADGDEGSRNLLEFARFEAGRARGASGVLHEADAVGGMCMRAGQADSAVPASDGNSCATSLGTLLTGSASSRHGTDSVALSGL